MCVTDEASGDHGDKFTKVSMPAAAPLMRQNVDTDLIIRIERLVSDTGRQGLGPYASSRSASSRTAAKTPTACSTRRPIAARHILSAGDNFGCGSSREGAVWALAGMGVGA